SLNFLCLFVSAIPSTLANAQAPSPTKNPATPPPSPSGPSAPQSRLFPILLPARGKNPAWSVRIGQKGPERLDRPGYPPITLESAEVTNETSGQAWVYHAKDTATGASVTVHLSREACSDAVSPTQ